MIRQAGYNEKIEFYEDYCYKILPKLLDQDRKFDFAYIDSTKQFDWLMVDFFFIDKLLKKGGVIVFDDVAPFPGIRKLVRYVSQFPDYKVYDCCPQNSNPHYGGKMLSLLKSFGKTKKYLRQDILLTEFELGISSHCVALQKINDDSRDWQWHKDF